MKNEYFNALMIDGIVKNVPPDIKEPLTNMLRDAYRKGLIKNFQIGNMLVSKELGVVASIINNSGIAGYMTEKDIELYWSAC